MARIDCESELIKAGYEKVDGVRSKDEAYTHVDVYTKTENRQVKRRWVCRYCRKAYSGNIGRARAHLGGLPGFDIVSCTSDKLPEGLKESMAAAAAAAEKMAATAEREAPGRQEENKKRKHQSGSLANPQEDDMNNEDISRTTDHRDNSFQFDNPDPSRGAGSTSSSLADQPLRVTSTGMPSQRSDLVEMRRSSFMAGPEDARAGSSNSTFSELGMGEWSGMIVWTIRRHLYLLEEREKKVETEQQHLEWTCVRVTTGQRKINEWSKQVGQVRERSLGLVKKLLDPMSTWTTTSLVEVEVEVEGLRKEVKELMEQSEEFIGLTANTVLEFVNCRLESPFKDHLKEILGCH